MLVSTYLDGNLSIVMIYNRPLTSTEIIQNYQATREKFEQWFDLMGLQRHLKAAGIFARLKLRDGKPGYMADIPLTLQYVIDIAKRYQNLTPLGEWVEKVVLPLVQQRNRLSKELTQ